MLKVFPQRYQMMIATSCVALALHAMVLWAASQIPSSTQAPQPSEQHLFEMVNLPSIKPVTHAQTPQPTPTPKPTKQPVANTQNKTTTAKPRPVPATTPKPDTAPSSATAKVAIPAATTSAPTTSTKVSLTSPPGAPSSTSSNITKATAGTDDYIAPDITAAYRDNPRPSYPLMAKRRGLEGVVLLALELDPLGIPQRIVVKQSSGHSILDDAALNAVRQWRFTPAQRAGLAVSANVEIPIRFSLNK